MLRALEKGPHQRMRPRIRQHVATEFVDVDDTIVQTHSFLFKDATSKRAGLIPIICSDCSRIGSRSSPRCCGVQKLALSSTTSYLA